MLEELKKEVCQANLLLPQYGLVTFTWGNVSGIDRKSGIVAIKPSGVPYEELSPEKIVLVDLWGNIVEGDLNPSSDVDTHLALYRSFAQIGGVVHTHSLFATSFAQAKRPLPPLGTTHADAFYGAVPCTRELTEEEIRTDYEKNTGNVIIETAENTYKKIPAVLVASHGPFAWGSTAKKAVENIAVLEETAKMAVYTLALNPAVKELSQPLLDKHFLRKHGENAYYGQKNTGRFDALLRELPCDCGKTHRVAIKKILLNSGALAKLPELLKELGNFQKIAMICDRNTYSAAGKKAETLCSITHTVCLDPQDLHADEKALETVFRSLPNPCDLLLAVGAGTIHDITRYIAHEKGIPFLSIPTAPSVDGFVSPVAAMTLRGAKVTVPAVCPIAMIADTDILACAPQRLVSAGFGDLLGKYTALADWKMSHIVTGEYCCDRILALEEKALQKILSNIEGIRLRQKKAVETLMYGLILSGIAMLMAGNSRPASGAEHHISHLIEMNVLNAPNDALHGEKVGVGTALCCDHYHAWEHRLTPSLPISENTALPDEEIRRIFGPLAEEIFKENENNPLSGIRAEQLRSVLPQLKEILSALPSGAQVRSWLHAAGAPCTLSDIGLPEEIKDALFANSPFVRSRLTFMRLTRLWDPPENI